MMGTVRIVDLKVPSEAVFEADGMAVGYECGGANKRVCVILVMNTNDGPVAVSCGIEPEDVDSVTDAIKMLNSKIGTGEWPDSSEGG